MTIKMIAVDMDGTFLNNYNDYNRPRFVQLYQQMLQKRIRFVVASGNQYYQLISFFPNIANEIAFVAENGALVVNKGKVLYHAEMAPNVVKNVLDVLSHFDGVHTILCGKQSAYVNKKEPDSFVQYASKYYYRLRKVPDLYEVKDDVILKFGLNCPAGQVEKIIQSLSAELGDALVPVSSGHEDVDLILPGVHKANGLKILQDLWDIDDSEIAAFGDSGNDYEMLKHVGHSFAMGNAADRIKAIAKNIAPSNNDDGVLTTIEQLLKDHS